MAFLSTLRRVTQGISQAQWRPAMNEDEIPLVTSGNDLLSLAAFAAAHPTYSAAQAIHYLCA
jgi:hypothetical protein